MCTSSNCTHDDRHHPLLIFDGGTGREIEAQGGPFRQPEWSALSLYEAPHVVQQVHENFLNAGAEGITTNAYAIVPFHIGEQRYRSDAHNHLLPLSVDLAQKAIKNDQSVAVDEDSTNNKKMVIGSIPPLCGSYEPEKFDPKVAGPILDDFLNAYLNGGSGTHSAAADVLLLETIGSIEEAKFYLEGIHKRFAKCSSVPIWLSFCVKSENGMDQTPKLLTSETLTQAIKELSQSNLLDHAEVVMVNCCDVRVVKDAIVELKEALSATENNNGFSRRHRRLGAYPNAFSIPPPDAANHTLRQVDYNITPQVFRDYAREWMNAGASVIGGCCGIGPNHIAALQELKVEEGKSSGIGPSHVASLQNLKDEDDKKAKTAR